MIEKINDSNTFLEICDKLDDVPDCKLSKKALYSLMVSGEYDKATFVFVNEKDNKINGCSILYICTNISGDLILSIIFLWIDEHYPKLWLKFMRHTEDKAKEYNVKKIFFTTSRNEKAIERKLGKYNYQKKYSVFEKEINSV